jgi:hypothetical protein
MQQTLSTSLWIKEKEKANEYSDSHSPTQRINASSPTLVGFFVCGYMCNFWYEKYSC